MINAERLRLMQRHAYLINTARGEIIDEPALIAALQARRIAGAGLDVFEHEPAVDERLLAMRHAVLLPHMVSATIAGLLAMGAKVIAHIRAWLQRPDDPTAKP